MSQIDRPTVRQTDKQTDRHEYKQTDRQTDRHPDTQTDRQKDRQTDTQTDRHTDGYHDRQTDTHTQSDRQITLSCLQKEHEDEGASKRLKYTIDSSHSINQEELLLRCFYFLFIALFQSRVLRKHCSLSEFNKFQPRLKSTKNRFQLSAGLNLEKFYTV